MRMRESSTSVALAEKVGTKFSMKNSELKQDTLEIERTCSCDGSTLIMGDIDELICFR